MTFGTEKLEWLGYPTVKKVWRYFSSFWQNARTWQMDGQTRLHSIAWQKCTIGCSNTVSIMLISLFLVSQFNLLSWWLPVSFLLHVKYTLSYRIVGLSGFHQLMQFGNSGVNPGHKLKFHCCGLPGRSTAFTFFHFVRPSLCSIEAVTANGVTNSVQSPGHRAKVIPI